MNIARFFDPNHIIARIMNEATGVALITDVIGSSRLLTIKALLDIAAKRVPSPSAKKNPPKILSVEYNNDFQKPAVVASEASVLTTLTGDAIIRSESIASAKASQTIIQKAIASIL